MQVESQICSDLIRPEVQTVMAMQHDGNTRAVTIQLLSNGVPWEPPAGVSVALGYEKPDLTRGLYDKLSDGTPAVVRSGSTVTVLLPQQMLSVPGTVRACVVFNDAQLNQLSTFPFLVQVQVNPAVEAPQSENYARLQWLEDKLDEYLTLAKESGEFNGPAGPGPVLRGQTVEFQVSGSYRQIPTGTWSATVPTMGSGTYLWSRTTAHYNSGDVVTYSVSRNGVDGAGSVQTICGVAPDSSGNVALTAESVGALPCVGGSVQGQINMNGQRLTGLPAPVASTDAASKSYVTTQTQAAVTTAQTYTDQQTKTQITSTLLHVSSWVGDSAPYTLFVPISGLEDDMLLRAYPVYGTDYSRCLAVQEASRAISFAKRSSDGITFTCLEEKPTASITVSVEIYR